MDSFNYNQHNVETEEANGTSERDTRLKSMGKAFRTIELCIALFFLLWVMLRLPFGIRIFSELLRRLLLLLLTPLIISLLSGVCVAAVMVKSYRVSTQNLAEDNVVTDFYENMVTVRELPYEVEDVKMKNMPLYEEVDVYEDKEIVMSHDCDHAKKTIAATCDIPDDVDSDTVNGLSVDVVNQMKTESTNDDEVVLEKQHSSPRDLLNDADFKKTIDAFIKNQREFLKLENRCDCHGEAHVYCY